MDTWTLQTGFPVVTVNRDYDNNAAAISQVNFIEKFCRSIIVRNFQDQFYSEILQVNFIAITKKTIQIIFVSSIHSSIRIRSIDSIERLQAIAVTE